MAKSSNSKKNKKLPKSIRSGDLPRSVDDVWEAGVGALAQAREGATDSFESLVALGGRVVDTGGKAARSAAGQVEGIADTLVGTAKGVAEGAADGVQSRVEGVVEGVLSRLGVPNRDEVLALRSHVEALEARIAALNAAPGPAAKVPEADAATAYEVRPHERGWAVQKVGAERATAVHATKKEALRDGRQTAKAHAPATLAVYKADGSVGETVDYGAD